jgi:hypothetical protein
VVLLVPVILLQFLHLKEILAVQDKMVVIQEVQVAVAQERQELMLQHHLVQLLLAELV